MGKDLNINQELQSYILNNGLSLHRVQQDIIRYNNSLGEIKRMQISISQCQFLHLIIKICNAKKILEIGTFTGLSTLSMALALPDNGKLITFDKNSKTNKVALNFFKKAKQDHKIQTIVKPALNGFGDLVKEKFDLIFIDADKMNYKNYYEESLKLLNIGGLTIIDNVLWYGEVVNKKTNKFTETIKRFNEYVSKDKRVENLIIPLGDGLTVCRKLK